MINVIIFNGKENDKADSFSLHEVDGKFVDSFIANHQTTDEKYWRKAVRYYMGMNVEVYRNE